MKFLVSIERDEDGMYVAECLSLRGCVSQGETEAQAETNIAGAIRECWSVRVEAGMTPPSIREIEVTV